MRLFDLTLLLVFIFIYVLFFIFVLYGVKKFKLKIDAFQYFSHAYISLVLIFSIGFLFFLTYTNPNDLNVDRWSAMNEGIKSIINLQYPYSAIDHLGGRTSNFPGLFILGFPFYLLHNVGYLQVFAFLLLAYTIYTFFQTNTSRLLTLILFVSSPAFFWEVTVRSDLMTNFILILIFMVLWYKRYKNKLFIQPFKLGFFTADIKFRF